MNKKDELVVMPGDNFKFTPTGLTIKENTTIDDWIKCGKFLRRAEGAVQFWLGDWINFGEKKYGEMYSQALEESDYGYGTLRNFAWIANKVELSSRNDNLSFKHHQLIAGFDQKDQSRWLKRASDEEWSVADMRKEINLVAINERTKKITKSVSPRHNSKRLI